MEFATARRYVEELVRRGTPTAVRWCPHDPTEKQSVFLELECLEALYGGAAGGGKSDALLMDALLDVDRPDFAALFLRRTYADLALPGAAMDRADDWLRGKGAHWSDKEHTWTFPSGATLTFGYLEHERDKYRYQGAEFQALYFDELTQFTETQYRYLLSRLRRKAGSTVRLRARSASNPGGIGHAWVKGRFVEGPAVVGTFVPAKLGDNPHVDRAEYEKALALLDEVTRKQLRDGLWIRDDGGLVYKFDPGRNLAEKMPTHDAAGRPIEWVYVWVLDLGASERQPTEARAVLAFSRVIRRTFLVESHKRPSRTLAEIAEQYEADKLRYGRFAAVLVDQGGLGSKFSEELRRRYGMPIEPCDKANKLGYRKLMNGDLERGELLVLEGANDDWVEEAQELTWNDKGTDCEAGQPDHATDAALYGWRKCRAYLAEEPEPAPAPGSPEAMAKAEAEMRARAEARVREQNNPKGRVPWLRARRGQQ